MQSDSSGAARQRAGRQVMARARGGARAGDTPRWSRRFYAALSDGPGLGMLAGAVLAVGAALAAAHWTAQAYSAVAAAALPALLAALGALALHARLRGVRLDRAERAAQDLRGLRDEYALAEELGTLGSWTYDVPGDRYHWSEGTFQVFGVDPAHGAPSARGFFICVHADDQARWDATVRQAIERGERLDTEFRYVKDGREIIWVRGVARPEFDDDGCVTRLTGIAQDVSAARRMAERLAESEAKFRDLTRMSSDWYWETDALHRLTYLSESAATKLGKWVHAWIGQREWELASVDFPRTDWDAYRARLAAHEPFDEFRFTRLAPDAALVHLELAGRPLFDAAGAFVGYRGVGRDMTRDRQQQLLLQVESDVAELMRTCGDEQRMITKMLVKLCDLMGWAAGMRLVRVPGRDAVTVHENWGDAAFTRMVAALPPELPLAPGGVEARSWATGKAVWLQDVATRPEFAARYGCAQLGLSSAFVAPILDEQARVMSTLLFLGPRGFRADRFISQLAGLLSHALSLYLQRNAAERQLLHASMHDALTGLPNRACLMRQIEARLARNEALALLYIDLDRYKLINDTLGHAAGDQVLIEVARRFGAAVGRQDMVGRIGGDEFVVMLAEPASVSDPGEIARRLLAAAERAFVLSGRAYFLSASIGVSVAPADATEAKALIRCADNAMYRVKAEGRNGVRFAQDDAAADQSDRTLLGAALPEAMARGELELHYQPVVALDTRRTAGLEARVQWRHPTRGLLAVESLLPAIEHDADAVCELGRWMLARAIGDRAAMGAGRWDGAPVMVDVWARQIEGDDLPDFIGRTLAEAGLPPRLLRLELSEATLTHNPERSQALLAALGKLGVGVLVDHFGAGLASLSQVRAAAVDGIKIDRSLVNGLSDDRRAVALVHSVAVLAARLGMDVLADGVASPADLQALVEAGCGLAQGDLLGEAQPVWQLDDDRVAPASPRLALLGA